MVTIEQVLTEAREWKNTPFQHQTRLKGVACDCAGLVVGVGLETEAMTIDWDDPIIAELELSAYHRQPDPAKMLLALSTWMLPIRKQDAGAADVIYRKYGGNPQHLAILTGPLTIPGSGVIHTMAWPKRLRMVREHRTDDEWYRQTVSAWRYPNLET